MKAIGYIRVSTEEQRDNGHSLSAQQKAIHDYGKLYGLQIVTIYSDDGVSAKTMDKRRGLQAAIKALENGEAKTLIIYKLDRLSRCLPDIFHLTDMFQKRDWQLHSITEKLDTGTASGRFVLTILGALAQMESEQLSERIKMGIREKVRKGGHQGNPPYGYIFQKGELVPDTEQQPILEQMLAFKDSKKSGQFIADHLNAMGVKTPKGGKVWHKTTVNFIVKKERARRKSQSSAAALLS